MYPLLVDTALYNLTSTFPSAEIAGTLVDVVLEPPGEAIVWTSAVGVIASGSGLSKSDGVHGWTGGAVSTKALASGDGWAEFTVSFSSGPILVFGLSHGNNGEGPADIDFGLQVGSGVFRISEGGVLGGSLGAAVPGDVLRVSVESGVVKYWRNGVALGTSAVAPVYPLLVDTALYNSSSTFPSAEIAGTLVDVVLEPPGEAIAWTSAVGVVASGSGLSKSDGVHGWTGGAVSTKALASGDGWAEFTVSFSSGPILVFGLSHGNNGEGPADIDFGLQVGSGVFRISEGGVLGGSLGAAVPGDVLRVSVESGVVKYWRNGTVLGTSAQAPVYPLLVDTALYNSSSTFPSAEIAGTLVDVVLEPPGEPIAWTNPVGVVASGSGLSKSDGVTGWTGGAVSTKALGSGDGWAEFTVGGNVSPIVVFGLSHGNHGEGFGDIDFGLQVGGSVIRISEGGVQSGSLGPAFPGDVLRVSVESGLVKYWRNGVALGTSAVTPAYPLLVDTALFHPTSTFPSAEIAGTLVDVVLEPPGEPIAWTNPVGVVASGSGLSKSDGVTGWTGGAVSTKALGSGDGWAEFTVGVSIVRVIDVTKRSCGQAS